MSAEKTMLVFGINSMLDQIFTLEADGVEKTWNVTRLERDAAAGKFGQPQVFRCADLPAPDYSKGNLDLEKIERMKLPGDTAIDVPCIAIGNPPGSKTPCLCFVDGQHRVSARYELGLPTFATYVVPHDVEQEYRVIFEDGDTGEPVNFQQRGEKDR